VKVIGDELRATGKKPSLVTRNSKLGAGITATVDLSVFDARHCGLCD